MLWIHNRRKLALPSFVVFLFPLIGSLQREPIIVDREDSLGALCKPTKAMVNGNSLGRRIPYLHVKTKASVSETEADCRSNAWSRQRVGEGKRKLPLPLLTVAR